MKDEFEKIWKEVLWPVKEYLGISLEKMEKTAKNLRLANGPSPPARIDPDVCRIQSSAFTAVYYHVK